MTSTHTLIIGASAAGLASAACLQKAGIDFNILVQLENPPPLAVVMF